MPIKYQTNGIGLRGGKFYHAPQSYNLGTCYSHAFMSFDDFKPFEANTIRLTGYGGEALYRQFFFWYDYSKKPDELFDEFAAVTVDVGRASGAKKYFEQYLRESISGIPRKSIAEQMEIFYLYYHHCKMKYYPSSAGWTPLQSKWAFRCKSMYMTDFVGDKFEFDLLSLMNPVLAAFPYVKEKHKKYSGEFSNFLYGKGYPKAEIVCNQVNQANQVNAGNTETAEEAVKNHMDGFAEWYRSGDTLLSALKIFLDYSRDFEEIGQPLYNYFANDRHADGFHSNKKFRFLGVERMRIQRILSVYWQIRLTSDNIDEGG